MRTKLKESALTEIEITSFRGISGLSVNPLGAINLITGDNNAGKTALLECLYLIFADNVQLSSFPIQFRSSSRDWSDEWDSFWSWLFPDKKVPGMFTLKFTFNKGDVGTLSTNIGTEPGSVINILKDIGNFYSSQIILHPGHTPNFVTTSGAYNWPRITNFSYSNTTRATDAEKFSKLAATADGEENMLKLVKIIDKRVTKLRYLKITSVPLVYADIGISNLVPISQMGQGFCILFSLFTELLTSKTDILLIDEIENGIHRDAMPTVWDGLAKITESQKIQLFATTHSKECITAAHSASKANESIDFMLHRLELVNSKIKCFSQADIL